MIRTPPWIMSMSQFAMIEDLTIDGVANEVWIKYFIDKILMPHPNCNTLLPKLSSIYVLIATKIYKKDKEDILNVEQYDFLEKNGYLVLGYMLVSNEEYNTTPSNEEHLCYIDYIDTVVRGNNIAEYMRQLYMIRYECLLIPREIIDSNVKYWAKKLFMDESVTKLDIDTYIKDKEIDKDDIKWKELYNYCDKVACREKSDDEEDII